MDAGAVGEREHLTLEGMGVVEEQWGVETRQREAWDAATFGMASDVVVVPFMPSTRTSSAVCGYHARWTRATRATATAIPTPTMTPNTATPAKAIKRTTSLRGLTWARRATPRISTIADGGGDHDRPEDGRREVAEHPGGPSPTIRSVSRRSTPEAVEAASAPTLPYLGVVADRLRAPSHRHTETTRVRVIRSSCQATFALSFLVTACADDGSDGSARSASSDGAVLYASDCASCHGNDLRGTDFGPSLLSAVYGPDQLPDDAIQVAIRDGVTAHNWEFGPMPAIGGLDDDENTAIITHIRDVQEPKGSSRTRPNDYRALRVKGDRRARCTEIGADDHGLRLWVSRRPSRSTW